MSNKNNRLSLAAVRKAEKELDAFLRQINAPAIDITAELKNMR